MIGGFNKLLRNFASLRGHSIFEKRLIKASYQGDMKEPKEKHVLFILDCINGKHSELIKSKDALEKLFDRFFNNLKSIPLTIKTLCIMHSALQEEDMSLRVAHSIKEKECLLYPYQKETLTPDEKMQTYIAQIYIDYIKNLNDFIIISPMYYSKLSQLHHNAQVLEVRQLFLVLSKIDGLVEGILRVYQLKTYCQTQRLFKHIVYLLFIDLLKIYQSYYVLVSVMLEKFENMSLLDAKRAFLVYLNFIKVNKEIRKMGLTVLKEFAIKLDIYFYDVDFKVVDALKTTIDIKEKQKIQDQNKKAKAKFSQKENSSIESNLTKLDSQTDSQLALDQWCDIEGQVESLRKQTKSPKMRSSTIMESETLDEQTQDGTNRKFFAKIHRGLTINLDTNLLKKINRKLLHTEEAEKEAEQRQNTDEYLSMFEQSNTEQDQPGGVFEYQRYDDEQQDDDEFFNSVVLNSVTGALRDADFYQGEEHSSDNVLVDKFQSFYQ